MDSNRNPKNPFDEKEERRPFMPKRAGENYGNNYLQLSTRAHTRSATTNSGNRRGHYRREYKVMDAKAQEEELERMEKAIKFIPLTEVWRRHGYVLSYDKIEEIQLDDRFQKLPQVQKFTKEVIAKCKMVSRFDIIPDEVMKKVFHNEPDQFVQTKDVGVYLSGESPFEFYLQMFRDIDRNHLLTKYMEDGILNKKLGAPAEDSIQIGDIYSTFSNVTGKWYRGKILEIRPQSYFKMVFLDYGITDTFVHYERLRELPKIAWDIQPLCIQCKLDNVEAPNQIGFDYSIRHEFEKMISGDEFFKITIISEDENGVKSIVLKRKTEEGIMEVNEIMRIIIEETKERLRNAQSDRYPNPEELPYLLHMNAEVDVKVFSQIDNKGLRNFKVTRVESPSNFNVELVTTGKLDPAGWYSQFQDFYNSEKNRTRYRVRTPRIYIFRIYAFRNPNTRYWERIRVREIDNLEKIATVLLVDIGEIQMVEYKDIYEMNPAYSRYSSVSFKAHLVDICPPNGKVNWPKESIDTFKALVLSTEDDEAEKVFHGIIMKRVDNIESEYNENNLELGLILIEKDENVTWTVQAEMVNAGVASAIGFSAGRQDLEGNYDQIPKFESNKAEISFQEEYGIFNANPNKNQDENEDQDVDNEDEVGDDTKSKSKFCSEVARIKHIVKIANTNREQMQCNSKDKEEKEEVSQKEVRYFKSWITTKDPIIPNSEHIPDFFRKKVGLASVVNVLSPGCFYIQLELKRKDLLEMEKLLEMVENLRELDYEDFKEGMVVAVLITDETNGLKTSWQRAILKTGFPLLKSFRCFLIDYTTELNVRASLIRPLPDYFHDFPSYATRVHFDVKGIMPAGGKLWTSDASQAFRKYVLTWEAEEPVYFAWRPSEAQVLEGLEEMHQEVEYDWVNKVWKISRPKQSNLDHAINAYRDDTILSGLYKSYGVDLSYEIFTKEHEFYNTAPLTDMLVKRGYVIKVKPDM